MTPDDIKAIESMCAIAENPLLYDEPGPAQMLAAWCRKLLAERITTAQQAVLDAAEAWAKATDSRLEKFFALHDAAVAMVAEKGNQNEDRNEI